MHRGPFFLRFSMSHIHIDHNITQHGFRGDPSVISCFHAAKHISCLRKHKASPGACPAWLGATLRHTAALRSLFLLQVCDKFVKPRTQLVLLQSQNVMASVIPLVTSLPFSSRMKAVAKSRHCLEHNICWCHCSGLV